MGEFKYQVKSWLEINADSDFSMYNFPFGIFQKEGQRSRACSAIGDFVIDLVEAYDAGLLEGIPVHKQHLTERFLNELIESGKAVTNAIRVRLQELFAADANAAVQEKAKTILVLMDEAKMLLPIQISDYTDFYSSRDHATNVGKMFRDPANALLPNWLHLPVGYHGRSSSIVVSGTEIKRPQGQMIAKDSKTPHFGKCRLLDFELEMGFIVGKKTELGEQVNIEKAAEHIFGMVLFNDWSARDIQKWEYVPLGPFLGKSFASTMSPWIVTIEALQPFRTESPEQDPEVLPYLKFEGDQNYDINLEVIIQPSGAEKVTVSQSNFKHMYWNMLQQLTHHTVNGCNISVGDLYASGTISGPTPGSYGSMLEISWQGTKSVAMSDGTERKFIQDGDTVILKGFAEKDGVRVGFGEASGKIIG